MSRITAGSAGIKGELRSALIFGVAQDVFPLPVIGRPGCFRTDARGVIEQLPHGDLLLAWIAERISPGNKLKCAIAEPHLLWRAALLTFFRRNGEHRCANCLRN